MQYNYFNLIGLIFNTLGAVVLLFPLLITKKKVDDDYILNMDMKTGEYTQKKHLKDRKLGLLGFILLALGFIFQILGIFIS